MSSNRHSVSLLGWEAWGPGLIDQAAWCDWLPQGGPLTTIQKMPPNSDAPPMLRRRYSMPSRAMLEVSANLCRQTGVAADALHLVFGSANGEINTLGKLLADLAVSQPLSPTAFSNSVHHVPTGHYSMAVKHKTLSRTISSFEDTFLCCFLDAVCLLQRQPELPALVVVADEIPQPPFDQMLAVPPFPYAVALLLSAEEKGQKLSFFTGCEHEAEPAFHQEPAFDFLRWLISDRKALSMSTNFGVFSWNKE